MTSKIESLEGELEEVKTNIISVEKKDKEESSKEKEIKNVFLNVTSASTLKKHKNTKHCMFNCKECWKTLKSQCVLEEHLNKDHVQSKSTYSQFYEDDFCPICSKGFMSKQNMLDHFKERHMNPIDNQ